MRAVEKRLHDRIKALESHLANVRADRQQFRKAYSADFRWLIKIHGEGQHPEMKGYIETKAKELRNFEWWYW